MGAVGKINTKIVQVGSSAWDKNEQRVLEDGLRYYPHDQHSNMLIYIRIAASLPKKTVRDVAHHLRQMQASLSLCVACAIVRFVASRVIGCILLLLAAVGSVGSHQPVLQVLIVRLFRGPAGACSFATQRRSCTAGGPSYFRLDDVPFARSNNRQAKRQRLLFGSTPRRCPRFASGGHKDGPASHGQPDGKDIKICDSPRRKDVVLAHGGRDRSLRTGHQHAQIRKQPSAGNSGNGQNFVSSSGSSSAGNQTIRLCRGELSTPLRLR